MRLLRYGQVRHGKEGGSSRAGTRASPQGRGHKDMALGLPTGTRPVQSTGTKYSILQREQSTAALAPLKRRHLLSWSLCFILVAPGVSHQSSVPGQYMIVYAYISDCNEPPVRKRNEGEQWEAPKALFPSRKSASSPPLVRPRYSYLIPHPRTLSLTLSGHAWLTAAHSAESISSLGIVKHAGRSRPHSHWSSPRPATR